MQYPRSSVILVAAFCLSAVCPPTSSAPTSSATSEIAVDNELCMQAAKRVLADEENNAVDAAVAAQLCLGVVNFQSSGIGGSMVMVVAQKNPNGGEPSVTVIDARGVAPESVIQGEPYTEKSAWKQYGPSSITVPGELKGMQKALIMFSNDSKSKRETLFKDAISYADEGFLASQHLLKAVKSAMVDMGAMPFHSFRNYENSLWFKNLRSLVQVNGRYITKKEDRVPPRRELAATLKAIVENGFDEFYSGTVATKLVNDFTVACKMEPEYCRRITDIISTQDLQSYPLRTRAPFKFRYSSGNNSNSGYYDVYTTPAPYSGPALAVFLGIVTKRVDKQSSEDNIYHYLTEAAKFAASYRMELGDPDFDSTADVTSSMVEAHIQGILNKLDANAKARPATDLPYYGFEMGAPEDGMGTTHISVVTADMAVSVTSSIGYYFGSGFMSNSTGVLFCNSMATFSFGEELIRFPLNAIMPRKRPLSSKCPAIVVDSNGDFKLVTGASGGKRIPSAVGQTMFYALTKETTAKVASCQPRVYADLVKDGKSITQELEMSENADYPSRLSTNTVTKLRVNHCQDYTKYMDISVVQSILINKSTGTVTFDAHSDVRKFGGTCNSSWVYHSNMTVLIITISFVVQYVCVYM